MTQISPTFCYLLDPRSKYSPQHIVLTLDVDEKVIFKRALKKWDMRIWTGSICL